MREMWIGRGLFGFVSRYGVEGGAAPKDLPSPRSDEEEEKLGRVA